MYFTLQDMHAYDAEKERVVQTRARMQEIAQILRGDQAYFAELEQREHLRRAETTQGLKTASDNLERFAANNCGMIDVASVYTSGRKSSNRAYEIEGEK